MSTVSETAPLDATAAAPRARIGPWTKAVRFGWMLEVLGGVVAYWGYDKLRELAMGSTPRALANAKDLVHAERLFGLYHERTIQGWFLHWDAFIAFWNVYYGSIHFVMPVLALVLLYRNMPERYVRWRNTLLVLLAIGIVGFWLMPLTPPRLMPHQYGFVDTPARYFNLGPQQPVHFGPNGQPTADAIQKFGNLYAAMPSLHIGWSTWSALALLPLARRRWLKALLLAYPLCTLFAIVVTGNHWFLDAVGGWIALVLAYGIAVAIERARARPRSVAAAA